MKFQRFFNAAFVSAILFMNGFVIGQGDYLTAKEKAEMDRLSKLDGHLKPLGSAGPFFDLFTVEGFPSKRDFFNKYVIPSTPLLMKGAAKVSPAFTKWTDSYFINHPDSEKITIFAEGRKKEVRTEPGASMSFKRFVEKYNTTDMYMVHGLPKHLRADVVIPPVMQCEPVVKSVIDVVTWFSSGGTKSVLHNDDVDNINCLYRGDKTLIFLNPHDDPTIWNRVIDVQNGGYSSLDVDAVDYTKFPDLSKVRYAKVDMTAGDCLYIPYRWYHQVNSFGSNLAVNLWWVHKTAEFLDLDEKMCGDFTGRNTIADITWEGMDGEGSDTPSGGAYGGAQDSDSDQPPTEEFLKRFGDDQPVSEPPPPQASSYSDDYEAPHLHGNDPEQPQEDNSDPETDPYISPEEDTITDKIYSAVIRLKKSVHMAGVKKYVLKKLPPPNEVWDDRCQEILINYFGMLDQNKDTVITVEDADLFYEADEKTLNQNYDVTAFFQDDLKDALVIAAVEKEKELVMKLVERGDIDKEQIATIFGNKFKMPMPDLVKEEL